MFIATVSSFGEDRAAMGEDADGNDPVMDREVDE
jgi:hypothetical protein